MGIGLRKAGQDRAQRQRQETREIGHKDNPHGAVQAETEQRQRMNENQNARDREHHTGQRIRHFRGEVQELRQSRTTPGQEIR